MPLGQRLRSDAFWAAAFALAVALVVSRPLLLMHGIPAFNHDWTWPPDTGSALAQLRNSASLINASNFGSLNYYIASAPGNLLIYCFVAVFGAITGVKVAAVAIVVTAALGGYKVAQRFDAPVVVRLACSLLLGASPVVANEFASGHIAYLFGYAFLPWVAWCALAIARASRVWSIAALFVLLTASISQPQFAAFNAIVLLAATVMGESAKSRIVLLGMSCLALLISPFAIVLAIVHDPLSALSFDRTNLHYEAVNSSAVWGSYIGSGSSQHYDERVAPLLVLLRSAGAIVLWILAFVVSIRKPRAVAFLALAALAAWTCAGVNGPLWGVLSYAFVHVPQTALFRELYHFSALVILGLVVVCSLVRSRAASAVLAAAIALIALPQLTGAFWTFVTPYDPAEISSIASVVAQDQSNGPVLFWPMLQPLGPPGVRPGADPDAFPIGSHPSVSEFIPLQPLVQLQYRLCDPHSNVAATLGSFGIRYVVVRPDWSSVYFQRIEPALRPLLAHRVPKCRTAREIFDALPVLWRGSTHALVRVDRSAPSNIVRLPVTERFEPSEVSPDPRRAWVDATRWQWWRTEFLGPVNPGVFALDGVAYDVQQHSALELWYAAPNGLFVENSRTRRSLPASARFTHATLPSGPVRIVSRGATLLAGLGDASNPSTIEPGSEIRRLETTVPLPLRAGLIAQYIEWAVAFCALIFISFNRLRTL